jgi:hypothetical protein
MLRCVLGQRLRRVQVAYYAGVVGGGCGNERDGGCRVYRAGVVTGAEGGSPFALVRFGSADIVSPSIRS